MFSRLFSWAVISGMAVCSMVSCRHSEPSPSAVVTDGVVISVKDQKLALMRKGKIVRTYPVSTSKFGLGDQRGSCRTPLGVHSVAAKIGDNQPRGMVFKSRRPTGEVVVPNSPGRDPIVTRILWLKGEENRNKNAFARNIYIHGTAEERSIGRPSSYGCIRMKSSDILDVYQYVQRGEPVVIDRCSLAASEQMAGKLMVDRNMQAQAIQSANMNAQRRSSRSSSSKAIASSRKSGKAKKSRSSRRVGNELAKISRSGGRVSKG
jgi:hypothetical protein